MRIGDWSSDVGSADLDKARGALQAAIAKHPSYATAHENLGDIYAALAGAAYSQAATLDTADQAVRRKLSDINQLDTGLPAPARSEKSRVGKAGVSTCRSRLSSFHKNTNTLIKHLNTTIPKQQITHKCT